jgi:hypothetical protein
MLERIFGAIGRSMLSRQTVRNFSIASFVASRVSLSGKPAFAAKPRRSQSLLSSALSWYAGTDAPGASRSPVLPDVR